MKKAIIILLVILIGIGVYIAVNQSSTENTSNPVQEPVPAPVTTPVVSSTQKQAPVSQVVPQIRENPVVNTSTYVDESSNCAQQSKAWFDSQEAKTTQNGLYPIQGLWTYTNHLNATMGKCFMLETFYGNAGTSYAGSNLSLYDVYDHSVVASYGVVAAYPNNPTCIINGASCMKSAFDAFLDSEMETTIY